MFDRFISRTQTCLDCAHRIGEANKVQALDRCRVAELIAGVHALCYIERIDCSTCGPEGARHSERPRVEEAR